MAPHGSRPKTSFDQCETVQFADRFFRTRLHSRHLLSPPIQHAAEQSNCAVRALKSVKHGVTGNYAATQDGDRVTVYPVFEGMDITPELRVRREPLRETKFVLDVHLGRLAAYLRMLGFDVAYRSCAMDPELVRESAEEKRILLTRDRGLLKHSAVTHGYWVRETDSRLQVAEVFQRFDLARGVRPFTRCMACNGLLRRCRRRRFG